MPTSAYSEFYPRLLNVKGQVMSGASLLRLRSYSRDPLVGMCGGVRIKMFQQSTFYTILQLYFLYASGFLVFSY
ncbi:hypothetical protein XELAEV_18003252mg [Xenopus laevis]|nr:hypothetical protein XELAEV_18003252mg [Xenopus laevis]